MTKPRLINCLPSSADAAGGDTVTIVGKDIDASATVDFIPFPGHNTVAAAVLSFQSFPNGIQHITVTAPVCPPIASNYFNRECTIRVTNPPYGEFDQLDRGFDYSFFDRTPSFVEVGTVIFKPEKVLEPIPGDVWFDSYTWETTLWRSTYEFTADGSGNVDFKALNPHLSQKRNLHGDYTHHGPYVTSGVIRRVVCDPDIIGGAWDVKFFDESGIDVFQGGGVGLSNVNSTEFIPTVSNQLVTVDDWMRFNVASATGPYGGGGKGKVHIYFTAV